MISAIKIERREDWATRLRNFFSVNRQRPFRWGSFDCCLFASNAVREITDVDLARPYRGQYHTMLGAFRICGGSIENLVCEIARTNGLEQFAQLVDARPGDVVLASINDLPTLGIVGFTRLAVFSSNAGLTEQPFNIVRRAWRIG